MIKDIETATVVIPLRPVPAQIIIIGAKAVLEGHLIQLKMDHIFEQWFYSTIR